MPHTPEEHFRMILGLTVADLAAQLATARATIEQLQEEALARGGPPGDAEASRTAATAAGRPPDRADTDGNS
jgi:hypothetical protein